MCQDQAEICVAKIQIYEVKTWDTTSKSKTTQNALVCIFSVVKYLLFQYVTCVQFDLTVLLSIHVTVLLIG